MKSVQPGADETANQPRPSATLPVPLIPDHELLRRIGTGSYGEVWLARTLVGTLRAIKVVYRQTFEQEQQFDREFNGLQKFEPISRSHDGLVDVLQLGRNDAAGYFYYVMELADDASAVVAADVRRLISKSEIDQSLLTSAATYIPKTLRCEQRRLGRIPVNECLDIAVALSDALAHLHEHGLVHRDIKPSNIIFVNGRPKLADIGLVADMSEALSFAQALHDDLALLQRGQSVICKHARAHRLKIASQIGLATAAIVVLVASGWLLSRVLNPSGASMVQRLSASPASPEVNSIAVLPFINENTNWTAHEYLCDAITIETMNALTNCAGLRVASRAAVFAFKRATNDLRQISQQLSVRTVLAGSMKKSSNQLHVAARLVNVADGVQIWSASYDDASTNIGAIQSGVVRQVTRALSMTLEEPVFAHVQTNLRRKLEAYQSYSEGWKRAGFVASKKDFTEGVYFFQQALEQDPNFPLAFLGLAQAYEQASSWHLRPKEAMPTAKNYILRALELDDTLANAHSKLGIIKLRYDYDWAGAEKELRLAVELERNGFTLSGLLGYCWVMGRWEEAEVLAGECRQLEPESPWPVLNLGMTAYHQRRYDLALEQAHWMIGRDAKNAMGHLLACRAYVERQEFPEALAALAAERALDDSPSELARQGYIYGRMGRHEDALKIIGELDGLSVQRYVSKSCWAYVYASLGDNTKALDFLERAYEERGQAMTELKINPAWDALRAEPRFLALLEKMGLEL